MLRPDRRTRRAFAGILVTITALALIWPASIAHATHNSVSGTITVFSVTSTPLLVNGYLVGEFGIMITAGAAVGAALVSRLVSRDSEDPDSGTHAPVPDRASRTSTMPQADPQ